MDYSPYYCKNFYKDRRKKAEETSGGAQNTPECPVLPPPRPPMGDGAAPAIGGFSAGKVYRGRRRGKVFFAFLLVVLCFAILFVSADMFSGGAVLDALKETFGPGQETYYFVARGVYSQKNRAETEASAVRENGGAGYLYRTANGYYVVLYSHGTKKNAELAKGNDSSLEIIEIRIREPEDDGLSEAQKKLCKEALDLIDDDIKTLDSMIASLSAGAMGREAALDALTGMRNDLLYKKEELLNAGIPVDNAYMNILEPLFGGLDAIVTAEPKEYFIQALRYVQIGAILAFPR